MGTSYGIYRASTIKGVPEDKRWSSEKVLAVIRMPWGPTPNVDAEDATRVPNPDAVEAGVVPKDPKVPESSARRMYIRKTDIVKFLDRWLHRLQDHDDGQASPVAHSRMQRED